VEYALAFDGFCSALNLVEFSEEEIADALNARKHYEVRSKRKKSGRFRTYVVSPPKLREVQDRLCRIFAAHYECQLKEHRLLETVHGCVRGKSPFTNALAHRKGKHFYHCDLVNAFGQVTVERLEKLFAGLPVSRSVVKTIIKLVTFRGAIPQGVPTSPVLFNWVCLDMDLALKAKIGKGIRYTRYVDDLVFSANDEEEMIALVPEVERVVGEHGFALSWEKCRRSRLKDGAVNVTGLTINFPFKRMARDGLREYSAVRLPKAKIREIRALLHKATLGECSQSEVNGALGWVRQAYRGSLPYSLEKSYRRYLSAVLARRVPRKKEVTKN
jgi:RNA-directed DNA polymerase